MADHPDLKLFTPDRNEDILWYHRNAPWNRYKLTHNVNFNLDWLDEINWDWFIGYDNYYPTDWDWDVISSHPNVTEEWLGVYKTKLNFTLLSRHTNFTYKWMNLYIGADWDLDYIIYRPDFTADDLLKVFLRPTQHWNTNMLIEKFGEVWCCCYVKVAVKIRHSYIKHIYFVENNDEGWYDIDQYRHSIANWLNPSYKRIIDIKTEGWDDGDDDDNFYLNDYFEQHLTYAAVEFSKQLRYYHIMKELLLMLQLSFQNNGDTTTS